MVQRLILFILYETYDLVVGSHGNAELPPDLMYHALSIRNGEKARVLPQCGATSEAFLLLHTAAERLSNTANRHFLRISFS